MSKHPRATRDDHDSFRVRESWSLVRGATGAPVRNHKTWHLVLHDGRVLRTRISRPVNRDAYGANLWSHILTHQLEVSDDVFWGCVRDGVLPDRGEPRLVVPEDAVPLYLLRELVERCGLTSVEASAVGREEAERLVAEYWHARALEAEAPGED
ncbi:MULTISPECIES: hypothetical protein [unclassified Frigoribacterium]|uniref:hypothetical protein n=1 Tax=unclassified Frigoribacterium TaxID=2627005 RepID=UPI0006F2F7CE|nr:MULTISPECIES: hypothetical protein [unclassified Frigoribacterium]KQO45117.1 hypothetical protein ASF07_15325 [Frigoribacterium sp. Leaf254]KQT40569.1 hypothetical protein ASG28_14455 [Frigoribacterium sp. Leaf415]